MPRTRVVGCKSLTIVNGQTTSDALSHEEFGDADALMIFALLGGALTFRVEVSPEDTPSNWFILFSGTTAVSGIAAGASGAAVALIPPSAKNLRIVASGAVGADKTIQINKMFRGFGT